MSLQVWLPLNGNLNNQGTANVTVTNSGATINNNGKLGKCYYFNNAYAWTNLDYSSFGTEFSVAFWYKIDTAFSGNRHLVCLANQAGWANLMFTCAATSTNTLSFNIANGSTSERALTTPQIVGSWQHVVFTFKDKVAKVYVNGALTDSAIYSINPGFSSIAKMGLGGSPAGQELCTTLYLNDVRVYDSCLSPEKIAVIAGSPQKGGLQIWLPLNGNLNNQGAMNISSTCNGSVDNSGKIGKCYKIKGNNALSFNYSGNTVTEFSTSFWMKIPSSMSSANSWYTFFVMPLIKGGSNTTTAMEWCPYYAVKTFAGYDMTWQYPGTDWEYDKWHLWTNTIEKVGDISRIKFYLDGILKKDYTAPSLLQLKSGTIYLGTNIPNEFSFNDFRIYDECLSEKEVKKLAQGLVLHYPLNNNDWGNPNLLNGFITSGNWGYYSTTLSSQTYLNDTTAPNGHCIKMIVGTASGVGGPYLYQYSMTDNMTQNEWYTVSFYIKSNKTHSSPISLSVEFFNNQSFIKQPTINTSWQKVIATGQRNTNTTSNVAICIYEGAKWTANEEIYVSSIKVEKGTKATPWCPNSSDALATTLGMNDGIEYDISGYQNNGTRTGTFSWSSDSKRYGVSTQFGSGKQITGAVLPLNALSASIWIKDTGSLPSSAICFRDAISSLAMGIQSNNLICGASNGNEVAYISNFNSNQSYHIGEWNHIIIIKSGTAYDIYINGVKQTLSSPGSKWSAGNPSNCLVVGGRGGSDYWPGKLSDLRIYATALSADDIKELYEMGH